MMARLDRFPKRLQGERKIPDFSLLSPERQDRASELLNLIVESDDIRIAVLYKEYEKLIRGLPLLGPEDPQQGPLIEVPGQLHSYWQWQQPALKWRSLNFHKLRKAQIIRFVELCERYGFEDGTSIPIKEIMLPLKAWRFEDRDELQGLLEVASN